MRMRTTLVRQSYHDANNPDSCTVSVIQYPMLGSPPEHERASRSEPIPRTVANTSRRRHHLKGLTQSPPRRSHQDQIHGIFTTSASRRTVSLCSKTGELDQISNVASLGRTRAREDTEA